MSADKIDLTGLSLLVDERRREDLSGTYDAEKLAGLFFNWWVPYLECQKCSRHEYCDFTKPHPYPLPRSAGRLAEIKCGVVEKVIANYVQGVFPLLLTYSKRELQAFLDGSYHLVQFVYDAEQLIGSMMNEYYMKWLGEAKYRALFFGGATRLRRNLDAFAGAVQHLDAFHTTSAVILTEGESEQAFLEKLGDSGLLWFQDLDVQSYSGRSNKTPKKLTMLARRLKSQGYELFVQADRDGKAGAELQALIREGLVKTENTFEFKLDFESAFPTYWLFAALGDLQALPGVTLAEFDKKMSARGETTKILTLIEAEYGYTANKIELAETLAESFNRNYFFLNNDDVLWSSEIGQFLEKIGMLP